MSPSNAGVVANADSAWVARLTEHLRQASGDARCIETHISWVLLAGAFAYKIKKPLQLDFLDFSTPALRRAACEEELRINRRSAPALYLDVVPITGSAQAPRIGGAGPVIDHALRMRRFPDDALLADRAARGQLAAPQIDALAERIAAFHADAERARADGPFGHAADIRQLVRDNFDPLDQRLQGDPLGALLDALRQWTEREGERLAPVFEARRAGGWVREGHGDLHLGNLIWLDGGPLLFDAIEFNAQLRWIDVMADVAFLFMDLHAHDLAPLAWRFLNGYLDLSGDHAGLAVLPFYAAYRALVRAKVAALRSAQGGDAQALAMARYLQLAQALTQPRERTLWLACGVSGAGKSSQSQPLIEARGIVRLRADVERKRLFGLAPGQSSAHIDGGIYTHEASARTYAVLLERARCVLRAGFPALVDATLLRQVHRAPFIALAQAMKLPCRLLVFDAPVDVLRERVRRRGADGRDASEATEAVLERQLIEREPLGKAERALATFVDTTQPVDWRQVLDAVA